MDSVRLLDRIYRRSESVTATELRAKGYLASDCETCKRAVILAKSPEGKWMALDPIAKVYTVIHLYMRGKVQPEATRNMLSFVRHDEVCK
jgi:hypothetical protein